MLRSVKDLSGFKIHASDGDIGKVDELYFDDHSWTVRYVIVDTGNWLISRKVLLSPESINNISWDDKHLNVSLTKKQIEDSPPIETEQTISRRQELELMQYYGWPNYWTGVGGPVIGAIPPTPVNPPSKTEQEIAAMQEHESKENTANLRSTDEVINYSIHATDGDIGHVEDFVFDDESWKIRYLVVDTKNILPGKKVILALDWITNIEWSESRVYADHKKDDIKNSPEFDDENLNRNYEEKLHHHYDRKGYWS